MPEMAASSGRTRTLARVGLACLAGIAIGSCEWLSSGTSLGLLSLCWLASAFAVVSAGVALAGVAASRWLPVPSSSLWIGFWLALYLGLMVNARLLPNQSAVTIPSILSTVAAIALAGWIATWAARGVRRFSFVLSKRFLATVGALGPALTMGAVTLLPLGISRPDLESHHSPRAPGQLSAVVIVIDTLRADHVSSHGYDLRTTPRIDALASRGIRFERAWSTSSWTVPAIASLFTGLPLSVHGATSLDRPFRSTPTLAHQLAADGLVTAGFSSNPLVSPMYGFERGFHTFVSYRSGLVHPVLDLSEGTLIGRLLTRWLDGDRRVVDLSKRWLSAHRDDRFLLYVHLMAPHQPYEPPAAYRRRFVDSGYDGVEYQSQAPGGDLSEAAVRNVVQRYDAEVAYADDLVAEILDALAQLDLGSSTAVVVTSDHGEAFGEHGQWRHGQTLHAEETRIPLIITSPRIGGGRVVSESVSLMDLHPTLLSLLGIDEPAGIDLLDERSHTDRPVLSELLAIEGTARRRTSQAVVVGTRRLVHDITEGRSELFDIEADLAERFPIIDPDLTLLMNRHFATEWWLARAAMGDARLPLSEEDRRRLRALGYTD